MPKKIAITFKGKKYESLRALVDAWNAERLPVFPATYQSACKILGRWKKKHPDSELTDKAIEKALTPQATRHAIQYKGKWYKGVISLYKALGDIAEIPYSRFHAKLNKWKKENPDYKLTDEDINSLVKRTRFQTDESRFIGPLRLMWEELPEPKLQWDSVRQKIPAFNNDFGREPTKEELQEISTPEEWMERRDENKLLGSNNRVLTVKELYDRIKDKKCSYSAFCSRIRRHKLRTNKKPIFEELNTLARPWGTVDRVNGILYRWTHKESGKVYIGITTSTLKERTRNHIRQAKEGPWRTGGLHEVLARDSRKAFKIEKLAEYGDIEELMIAEMIAIEEHNCMAPKAITLMRVVEESHYTNCQ